MPRVAKIKSVSPPKQFMAIDASTNSAAFAIYSNGKISKYGKVKFSGHNINEKLRDIAHKSLGVFAGLPSDMPIVIEDTIFTNSHNTAAQLAKAQGALLAGAFLSGATEALSVSPIAWQSYIGTRLLTPEEKRAIRKQYPAKSAAWYKAKERDIRKHRTIDTVNARFGLSLNDDDIADAIGILMYAEHNWGKLKAK